MKNLNADIAYKILCNRIKRFQKKNDKNGLEGIERSQLFKILTAEQRKPISNKSFSAVCDIVNRLCSGELTPMMISNKKKSRSTYTYYLRYLTDTVYKENPAEAKRLAFEVRRDILHNKFIEDKDYWDERYFYILFEWGKCSYAERMERSGRFMDAAIRKGI